MLLDNIVFTRGAAAHLPDKPLIAFYDTHGWKGVRVRYACYVSKNDKLYISVFLQKIYAQIVFLLGFDNHMKKYCHMDTIGHIYMKYI